MSENLLNTYEPEIICGTVLFVECPLFSIVLVFFFSEVGNPTHTLLEEMVLFRTRNGFIPRFIYGTPKWFYIEPFFLVKGSIGQVWNPMVLYRTQRNPFFKSV